MSDNPRLTQGLLNVTDHTGQAKKRKLAKDLTEQGEEWQGRLPGFSAPMPKSVQNPYRKAWKQKYFPYLVKTVPMWCMVGGQQLWAQTKVEKQDLARVAHAHQVPIYSCWPGKYRSDLFEVRPTDLAEALQISLGE